MATVSAFVIAGGQSTRMGRDKALLSLDGRSLLERAVTLARSVSDEVSIVGPRERIAELRNCGIAELKIVKDIFPGQGPLAGIHAALKSSEAELNLMLGVDTPFLKPHFVQYLIAEAEKSGAVVTVPVVGSRLSVVGTRRTNAPSVAADSRPTENRRPKTENPLFYQPLCAVYRREFAAVAEEALRQGRNNIVPLFAKVRTREIGDEELRKMGFDAIMFENLNTPEEFKQAQRRVRQDGI